MVAEAIANWLKWSKERLLGMDPDVLHATFYQRASELASRDRQSPKILLIEVQPERFLGSFMAACTAECWLFLGNPHWSQREYRSVVELVAPDTIWDESGSSSTTSSVRIEPNSTDPPSVPLKIPLPSPRSSGSARERNRRGSASCKMEAERPHFVASQRNATRGRSEDASLFLEREAKRRFAVSLTGNRGDPEFLPASGLERRLPQLPIAKICIPTGGSSGKIRFAVHTWETLSASVEGFVAYFDTPSVNSCCTLPLYHVSGLMQWMRSLLTGGTLAIVPSYKQFFHGIPRYFNPEDFFISLVPTQLQRLLQKPEVAQWLSQFKTVLLGGAPAWEAVLEQARSYRIRLSPTYGSTETASQVATLKPEEFLDGNDNGGRVLPHAQITICDESGKELKANQTGIISVRSRSLFLGYYEDDRSSKVIPQKISKQEGVSKKEFTSDDLGYFDDRGYLYIVGRCSQKMITGGENVFPAEVEAAIRSTDLVADVAVIGIEDREWGEVVAAIYVPKDMATCEQMLKLTLSDRLAKFKHPKRWIKVESIPRNDRGKLNYKWLQSTVT